MMSGGDTRGKEKSASVERGVSAESSSHGRIGDLGF